MSACLFSMALSNWIFCSGVSLDTWVSKKANNSLANSGLSALSDKSNSRESLRRVTK